jgi:hypothetical protein
MLDFFKFLEYLLFMTDRVFLNVPIDLALRGALKAKAAMAGKTMTEYVIALIEKAVAK